MEVVVATIGAPHGLKGAVTLRIRTDEPEERFYPGAQFNTDSKKYPLLTVVAAKATPKSFLVLFEEITDRNGAEDLRGIDLIIDAPESDTAEDAFYPSQLRGYAVTDLDGNKLGEVIDLEIGYGQDRLIAKIADKRVMIPFVRAIVTEINKDAQTVVADIPPGLLEL